MVRESKMGHYHKKPYKKQSLNRDSLFDLKKEVIEEMDRDFDMDDDYFFNEDELTMMFDEPEIVKQLRREELEGKLPLWVLSEFDNHKDDRVYKSVMKKTTQSIKTQNKTKIESYDQLLEIARNSFKKTISKEDTSNLIE